MINSYFQFQYYIKHNNNNTSIQLIMQKTHARHTYSARIFNSRAQNVINNLKIREYSCNYNYRSNLKLLKRLLTNDAFEFIDLWSIESSKKIAAINGCIYTDHYTRCYSSFHCHTARLMYTKTPSNKYKIEDAVVVTTATDVQYHTQDTHRPCILALTKNSHLLRMDAVNGTLYDKIYFCPQQRFKYAAFDSITHTLVLMSSKHPKTSQILFTIAVFDVHPLKIVAVMEITKKVFGSDVSSVTVSHGVVMVTRRQSHLCDIYSLDYIVSHFTQFEMSIHEYNKVTGTTVGQYPHPLPVNVSIHETPPLLASVRCGSDLLSIGGHPWHILFTPPNKTNSVQLCDIVTGNTPINGNIAFTNDSMEVDQVMFHEDESNRLIHIYADKVAVLRLTDGDSVTGSRLLQSYVIDLSHQPSQQVYERHRLPRKRSVAPVRFTSAYVSHQSYTEIDDVSHEDELDLLCVSSVYHNDDSHSLTAHLCHNHTGAVLKTVPLVKLERHYTDQLLMFDLDKLIHIVDLEPGKHQCTVYSLQRLHNSLDAPMS